MNGKLIKPTEEVERYGKAGINSLWLIVTITFSCQAI
ncbi:MAG: hypothetical protein ACJA13_002036 [Paraglaciecola sp.]|jgi:hypothetical protein